MPRRRTPPAAPQIRDRIRELRRVRASELVPHPRNWRTHPDGQRAALRGVLAEIGYADALLARELPDGRLQLIDGHLRAQTTPQQQVPVLVVDLSEQEADKLLLTLDPLAGLAGVDQQTLDALLAGVEFESRDLVAALAQPWGQAVEDLVRDQPSPIPAADPSPSAAAQELGARYCVLIQCTGEEQQVELLERLHGEGLTCRALIA